MRKGILLTAVLVVSVLSIRTAVSSASSLCSTSTTNGTVTVSVPTLPGVGSYHVWTRMQVPDATHNQYELKINKTCYQVGGASITPGTWTWVSFQNGDLTQQIKTSFDRVSGNVATLNGTQAGVKVDRLLFIQNDCVPEDLGNNCQLDAVPATSTPDKGANEVVSISNGPVSGFIIPSFSITLDVARVEKVIYYVDGAAVPTSRNYELDTTLLTNGSHRIGIQITKTDGTVINEATTIEVQNQQTAWSPLRRIWRLHQSSIITLSTILGVILLIFAILSYIKHVQLKKRLMTFHGF